MSTASPRPATSPALVWIGRILSLLVALMLIMSGVMKLTKSPQLVEGFAKFGYPESLATPIGIVELISTALYLIPQTAVLGAILLTGYLGGATATHVRVDDPWSEWIVPVVIGVVLWCGLYLRDARIRGLAPIRRLRFDPIAPTTAMNAAAPATRPSTSSGKLILVGLLALLIGVVGTVLGLATQQPDELRITRTAKLKASPDAVFDRINDFHKWEAWSPWAKLDPQAKNDFDGSAAGEGAMFHWSGNNQIGEGKMTILESRPSSHVKIKLEFMRPMACINTTEFSLHPDGEDTAITWTMYGPNQFMGKVMGLFMNMDKMIGADFEQGLANIRTLVESKP